MSETKINLTPELQEQLVKIAPTAYSCSGFPPASSKWEFTVDQVRQIIKKHAKTYLNDVADATVEANHDTGSIYGYVWLPKKSKNVCDNELNTQSAAINRTMTKYSKELNEFMDKFCAKNRKRVVAAQDDPLVGIEIKIDEIMKLELDEQGIQYGKLFGDPYKKKTRITCYGEFTKADTKRYGKLCLIHVEKAMRSSYKFSTPKPRKSYNAR